MTELSSSRFEQPDGAVDIDPLLRGERVPESGDEAVPSATDGGDGGGGAEVPMEGDERGSSLPPGARAFFDWVVVVGIALLVAILVRTFLLAHFVVEGSSMRNTLHAGDRVFVNKLSYRLHEPNRGDVVVLHEIQGANERDLIKRVIALPGEVVAMDDCVVTIDGQRLIEPYLDPTVVSPGNCGRNFDPLTVPEDHVFVMGDNRPGSQDSRDLGSIPYEDLVGRAFVVFWPRSDWQWL